MNGLVGLYAISMAECSSLFISSKVLLFWPSASAQGTVHTRVHVYRYMTYIHITIHTYIMGEMDSGIGIGIGIIGIDIVIDDMTVALALASAVSTVVLPHSHSHLQSHDVAVNIGSFKCIAVHLAGMHLDCCE